MNAKELLQGLVIALVCLAMIWLSGIINPLNY